MSTIEVCRLTAVWAETAVARPAAMREERILIDLVWVGLID